jgi:uncharacterized OB-fold protein
MRETDYAKPLPLPSDITRPFWAGLLKGEFRIQRCEECGKYVFYPRIACPNCLSDRLAWVTASGKGRLYSFTVVRRAMNPAFQADVPYVFAIVELEEGPRVTTNVVNCDLKALSVDMPVKAVYDRVTPEAALLKFEPA